MDPIEAARKAAQSRSEGQSNHMSASQPLKNALNALAQGESGSYETFDNLVEALYGAVLRALPASIRTWYQSLSDKRQASALEVSDMTFLTLSESTIRA